MKDIRNFDIFVKTEPIHKGWSGDRKYYLETKDGERFLLRVSDISSYETKQHEFEIMKKISAAGIKMSLPISFGICEEGKSVYLLLSWCDGEEAKEALYHLSDAEQYVFGRKAANVLKQMEAIDYKLPSQEWSQTYQGRVAHYIELYRRCGYTFDGDDVIISFLRTQRHCIGERPTALMHEDFQTDNMVISSDGELYMIDFQMCGETDPYLFLADGTLDALRSFGTFGPLGALHRPLRALCGPLRGGRDDGGGSERNVQRAFRHGTDRWIFWQNRTGRFLAKVSLLHACRNALCLYRWRENGGRTGRNTPYV